MDDSLDGALEGSNGAAKMAATHMSKTFHDRIARGNNLTKMGNSSNPRDTAMLIAAQASGDASLAPSRRLEHSSLRLGYDQPSARFGRLPQRHISHLKAAS